MEESVDISSACMLLGLKVYFTNKDDTGGGGGVWCCWLAWAGRPWVWGLPGAGGLALMLHVSVWWYTAYPHHHLCITNRRIRTWSLGRVEFCSFKKKEKKLQNIFLPQFAKVSESAILNYHELFYHMNVQPLSCSSATNQKCLTVLQFSHKSKVLLCLIWCCSEQSYHAFMKTVKTCLSDQTQLTDVNSNEIFSEHFLSNQLILSDCS